MIFTEGQFSSTASTLLQGETDLHILNALPPKSFSAPSKDTALGSPRSTGLTRGLKKVLSGWKEGFPLGQSEQAPLAPIPSDDIEPATPVVSARLFIFLILFLS